MLVARDTQALNETPRDFLAGNKHGPPLESLGSEGETLNEFKGRHAVYEKPGSPQPAWLKGLPASESGGFTP